jgi:hypothetical protein
MARRTRILLALIPLFVCLVAASLLLARPSVSATSEEEHEQLVYRGITACGVERWAVKTGIDADARRVDRRHIVSMSIAHLRSLPAPSSLPPRNRIAPTEFTEFQVQAILIRVKQESDSDFHLVLADSGGRTMIAEIPAPACVGSSSPFLQQLRSVRAAFTSRFHPTNTWQRGHWPVVVTGVGYFDFKHGQSGVAPNAIELHPVLTIRYGTGAAPPAPPRQRPTTKPAAGLHMSVSISPNPVPYGAHPTLTVVATRGASCTADVLYSTGRRPVSFNGSAQTVGGGGSVSWSWHMESKGSSGTATVTCSLGGRSATQSATFGIV